MNKIITLLFVLLFAVSLFSCSEEQEKITPSGESLKIGFIGPMSGPDKVLGEDGLKGIKTALHIQPYLSNGDSIELLVEDDKISCLAINAWLTGKGHKVIIAANGRYAIEYLQENKVDVILMDVHMPEMNGIEATKIIKEKSLSQAPIIGMTASVMNDERESYIEAGMDVVVEKPVNFECLIDIVKNKLTKSKWL